MRVDFNPESFSPRPGSWTVKEAPPNNGYVINRTRQASVPRLFGPVQEHIRLHEAYHVMWSPEHGMTLGRKMAEEIYVDAMAYRDGVDVTQRHDAANPEEWDANQLTEPHDAATYFMQFFPTAQDLDNLVATESVATPPVLRKSAPKFLTDYFLKAVTILKADDNTKFEALAHNCVALFCEPTPTKVYELGIWADAAYPTPRLPDHDVDQMLVDAGTSIGKRTLDQHQKQRESKDRTAGKPDPTPEKPFKMKVPKGCGGEKLDLDIVGVAADTEDHPYVVIAAGTAPDILKQKGKQRDYAAAYIEAHQEQQHNGDKRHDKPVQIDTLTRIDPRMIVRRTRTPKGHMQIEELTFTTSKLTSTASNPVGFAAKGTQIGDITRWWRGKDIYMANKPGGTLLIDVSGSMSWDWKVLRDAIRSLPAVTIAMYAGTHGAAHDIYGRLIIVAKNGRWADVVKLQGELRLSHGNEVDFEALEWLAGQRGPRVWLSDGKVCGSGNELWVKARETPLAAKTELHQLCAAAKIYRSMSVPDTLHYLRTGSPRNLITARHEEFINWRFTRAIR